MLDYTRPRSWRAATPVNPARALLHKRAPGRLPDNESRSQRAGRHPSRKSPKVRICAPSTGRRPDRLGRLPSFAAIAGVARGLAAGLIRETCKRTWLSLAWASGHLVNVDLAPGPDEKHHIRQRLAVWLLAQRKE
jgi:hypothetical protein